MTLQIARDAAIVLMAVVTILVGIGTLVLIWQVWKLVGLAKNKVELVTGKATDILENVKETSQTAADTAKHAQGTAEFVGDRTARPVIELYSVVAGAQRFAEAIFRRRPETRNGGEK